MRAATRLDTELLRAALESFLVSDDGARPNYSVEFGRGRGSLHLLRWGSCLVARERTPGRLLDALLHHLGAHVRPLPERVRLNAALVAIGDKGILIPSSFRSFAWRAVPLLADVGAELVASPHVDLDLESGRIVVPTPLVARPAPLERLNQLHGGGHLESQRVGFAEPISLAAMLVWLPGQPPGDLADVLVGLVGHQVVRPSDVPTDRRERFVQEIGKISSGTGTVNELASAVRALLRQDPM